ncbi:prephenate dehydrogenase/arogenate dehydrogenase family protein [Actinoplanes sp. N902-109]|uniref:prephenate dehydrogenase n=1 Tax=Actinoplanes sp. (strain N902-109) TaxID=649831 RepID=UPI000329344C|nr:prephenate dehydrogenase/arogenate dehydrogenase family protein [Actinoplanes sp. N902-109]AGL21480.1 Prephenate dehydrogenase [Actinoplanes sp. N902-109]
MNVAIIGLGLIGGSLLRALTAHGHPVVGYDVDPATRSAAAAEFVIAETIPALLQKAEIVILAVPLPALSPVRAQLAGFDGLLTDVTSVKGPVLDLFGDRRYVGGHPMAGKESSSFAASDPALFTGCAWVLCLEPGITDLTDWATLAGLYTSIGARIVPATAADHDQAVARISHVPHLLAAALATLLEGNPLAGTLAAGSFRDGTRVAATRAELIAAMCGGNAVAVQSVLSSATSSLAAFGNALGADDPVAALTPLLRRAGELRRGWPAAPGVPVEVELAIDPLLALGRAGGWITRVTDRSAFGLRPESDRNPA